MDEVDKIIIHTLRQIGCKIDDNITMANFTPELLVHAVSTCLSYIKPNMVLPNKLPLGMAQRFAVACTFAEACASCNYRDDIGYQTFLYPNTMDVRRLIMFLIEQLPRHHRDVAQSLLQADTCELQGIRNQVKQKLTQQMNTLWVPQYCNLVNIKRSTSCMIQNVRFSPHPYANILRTSDCAPAIKVYFQQQAPNIFQQTSMGEYDLISSVLQKNYFDIYTGTSETIENLINKQSNQSGPENYIHLPVIENMGVAQEQQPTQSPLAELCNYVNSLKLSNDSLNAKRKDLTSKMTDIRTQQSQLQLRIRDMQRDAKFHERSFMILENPVENLVKMEALVVQSVERHRTVDQQWKNYRQNLLDKLNALQLTSQTRKKNKMRDTSIVIKQLETVLGQKCSSQLQLNSELKSNTVGITSRKEYTRRILEFISNIRKQRDDIYKVLDDTRDLQKQLNSVSAQLHRQFNYTDDLFFQSAKHDLHAKKAYKLLALLHSTCNNLVNFISKTGNVTKEIRDLEIQIDREKLKNVAINMEQISNDIKDLENVVKTIKGEISSIENRISVA